MIVYNPVFFFFFTVNISRTSFSVQWVVISVSLLMMVDHRSLHLHSSIYMEIILNPAPVGNIKEKRNKNNICLNKGKKEHHSFKNIQIYSTAVKILYLLQWKLQHTKAYIMTFFAKYVICFSKLLKVQDSGEDFVSSSTQTLGFTSLTEIWNNYKQKWKI